MIESISRTDNNTVVVEINTGLCIKEPVIYLKVETESELEAELLRQHLNDLLEESNKNIARNCLQYLNGAERSALKSKLKEWNGAKHCWKDYK